MVLSGLDSTLNLGSSWGSVVIYWGWVSVNFGVSSGYEFILESDLGPE